jgi:GT2 family glycosyltransferase
LALVECLLVADAISRFLPGPPPLADPGPPSDQETTFIVPTHNQRHLVDFCLPPLLAEAGSRHAVLVVDDASTDATAEHVRQTYPTVKLLRLETNQGFGGAVTAGIAATSTPLFALINSDVQVRPGFLAALLPHFDREDTFAVCARIELPNGSQMETGNVAPGFSGILEPYHVPPDRPGPIIYAGGASSVFSRSRYEALGGLDSLYHPFYWEDIDLGYSAWRRGWRSLFEPSASVLHQRRAAIGAAFGHTYADQTFLKNALLFIWKNLRDRRLLAQHWGYVSARLMKEVPAGEPFMCHALLRAIPRLPRAIFRRHLARRRGDLSDRDILAMAHPITPADSRDQAGS